MVNSSRRKSNTKYIFTKLEIFTIHEAKTKELKGQVDKHKIIKGELNTTVSVFGTKSRQKFRNYLENLNSMIN